MKVIWLYLEEKESSDPLNRKLTGIFNSVFNKGVNLQVGIGLIILNDNKNLQ